VQNRKHVVEILNFSEVKKTTGQFTSTINYQSETADTQTP